MKDREMMTRFKSGQRRRSCLKGPVLPADEVAGSSRHVTVMQYDAAASQRCPHLPPPPCPSRRGSNAARHPTHLRVHETPAPQTARYLKDIAATINA